MYKLQWSSNTRNAPRKRLYYDWVAASVDDSSQRQVTCTRVMTVADCIGMECRSRRHRLQTSVSLKKLSATSQIRICTTTTCTFNSKIDHLAYTHSQFTSLGMVIGCVDCSCQFHVTGIIEITSVLPDTSMSPKDEEGITGSLSVASLLTHLDCGFHLLYL